MKKGMFNAFLLYSIFKAIKEMTGEESMDVAVETFCENYGYNRRTINDLINLRTSPLKKGNKSGYRQVCKHLSMALGERLVSLFPDKLYGVKDQRIFEIRLSRIKKGERLQKGDRVFNDLRDFEELLAWTDDPNEHGPYVLLRKRH